MRLRTDHWVKPIPDRRFDWECADADNYEPYAKDERGIIGHGITEFAAIVDWLIQWEPQMENT